MLAPAMLGVQYVLSIEGRLPLLVTTHSSLLSSLCAGGCAVVCIISSRARLLIKPYLSPFFLLILADIFHGGTPPQVMSTAKTPVEAHSLLLFMATPS